jgi:hypothetical protein
MPRRIRNVREQQKEADQWTLGYLTHKKAGPIRPAMK